MIVRPMRLIACLLLLLTAMSARASSLTIEITQGLEGALPIAVVPFAWRGDPGQAPAHDVGAIVAADLQRSGRFKPLPAGDMLTRPSRVEEVDFRDWCALNVDNLVIGEVSPNGPGGYLVRFYLYDVFRGEQIIGDSLPTTARDLRAAAHHVADVIYETLTGDPGAFNTRIAYVTSIRSGSGAGAGEKVELRIADADGYGPQAIVSSKEPIMSPAWSPDRSLRPLTRHWAIDTEPSWAPDGKSIVFTSDRGGSPQIYRVPVGGGEPSRVTFDGSYNARASFSPDGSQLAMVTRVDGQFRIATLDLKRRDLRILSNGRLDESPSFAPNGSMIIYATQVGGKGMLAAVSTDGRVQQRLKLQEGDVREPVWSPYQQQQRVR